MYTNDTLKKADTPLSSERLAMAKTARSGGAVGKKAIVPRFIMETEHLNPFANKRVLDFGCGPNALHVQELREAGINAVGYERGDIDGRSLEYHTSLCIEHIDEFSTVYASNVLNVQPDILELRRTLKQIAFVMNPMGRFVYNYPKSPRKSAITIEQIHTEVKLALGSRSDPWKGNGAGVFVAHKSNQAFLAWNGFAWRDEK